MESVNSPSKEIEQWAHLVEKLEREVWSQFGLAGPALAGCLPIPASRSHKDSA